MSMVEKTRAAAARLVQAPSPSTESKHNATMRAFFKLAHDSHVTGFSTRGTSINRMNPRAHVRREISAEVLY